MTPDPRDGFGQPGDGVLVVHERTVPRPSAGLEPHPGDPLLSGFDQVQPLPVVHGVAEAAHLADRDIDTVEEVGSVLDQPVRAESATGLLIGEERHHQRTAAAPTGADPVADDGEHHRVHVLHVDCAAAPQHRHAAVVGDLAGERRVCPVVGVGRHDIEMAVQQQSRSVGVGAFPTREDTGATRCRLDQLDRQADLAQEASDVLGSFALVRARVVAVVAGVHPDQVATDVDDLTGRVRIGHLGGAHPTHRAVSRSVRELDHGHAAEAGRACRSVSAGSSPIARVAARLVRVAELADALA